jgi:8-oxo-dGTP pyrophosphatase MutT (NUDIX family)
MDVVKLKKKSTQIWAEDRFRPENIDCFYRPSRILFNKTERSYIDREWNKEMRRRPSIFDGKLFHVRRQELLLSHLKFYLRISSFKEWVGTKGNEFKTLFRKEGVVRPLSVGSMIVTSDDKWIIGRRRNTYDFEGQYTLVAGYMDPDNDIVNSIPDPFFAIKREIEEETGISRNQDISSIICLGADGADQPYLAFKTQLKLSYAELKSNMPLEKEFREIEAYRHEKDSIKNFITSNYKELTPHTLANVLMSLDMIEQ